MKDRFSSHAKLYARYRPQYPKELFDFIEQHCNTLSCAWDCGTGNGQVAQFLANCFTSVYATDISQNQLQHAQQHPRIFYSQQAAEKTSFPDAFFDAIVVAQAIHWFNFEAFYHEVKRTIKPGGLLVVTGYNRPAVLNEIDALVHDFYNNVIGKYWDRERHYIDENYQTIPFPFTDIPTPELYYECQWQLDDYIGYLNTWSAVQQYIKINNQHPLEALQIKLQQYWPSGSSLKVRFPILLRAAYIHS